MYKFLSPARFRVNSADLAPIHRMRKGGLLRIPALLAYGCSDDIRCTRSFNKANVTDQTRVEDQMRHHNREVDPCRGHGDVKRNVYGYCRI